MIGDNMIDLHLHTKYSDGADEVIDILKKAQELKVKYISITDHETTKAYNELNNIDISKYYDGKIIPGIEIKCAIDGRLIEILGYNIEVGKMQKLMDEFYKEKTKDKLQQKYFDKLYNICLELNVKMNRKEDIEFNPNIQWASVTIYNEIKRHEGNYERLPEDLMESFNTFSKKYCADINGKWYIDKSIDYPSVAQTVEFIRKCNGYVFVPHIHIFKWVEDKEKFVDRLVNEFKIDGIECFHSEFSKEEMIKTMDMAKKHGIYMSGGSDYHGINKKDVFMKIGKNNIPELDKRLIRDWIKDVKYFESINSKSYLSIILDYLETKKAKVISEVSDINSVRKELDHIEEIRNKIINNDLDVIQNVISEIKRKNNRK